MGIDVWRPRTIDRVRLERTLTEAVQESTGSESLPLSSEKESVEPRVRTTEKSSSRKKSSAIKDRKQESTLVQHFKTEVFCSYGSGLLLMKDKQALDRDLTEDIFRSYRLLKDVNADKVDISFFRFFWPQETRLRYDKGEIDDSLDGARLAFLATTRTSATDSPRLVLAIGPSAVRLSDCGISDNARVLHSQDEPDSSTFKRTLWKFLRDEQ